MHNAPRGSERLSKRAQDQPARRWCGEDRQRQRESKQPVRETARVQLSWECEAALPIQCFSRDRSGLCKCLDHPVAWPDGWN